MDDDMKDEATLRVFFAITLNESIRSQLSHYLVNLRKACTIPVRWVREQQLHMTLQFLGGISDAQLVDVCQAAEFLSTIQRFEITLQQVISFPSHKPRIIGIKISPSADLIDLVSGLEDQLHKKGFEQEERAFLPHITLGRIAKPRRRNLMFNNSDLPIVQTVTSITLFKSELTPEGSIYTVLKEFPLLGGDCSLLDCLRERALEH